LFDDNVVAAVVDGEAAPPTLSAPNAAAVPNVPDSDDQCQMQPRLSLGLDFRTRSICALGTW